MPDVEVLIKADTTQYIASTKEAMKANEQLHESAKKGMKMQKGLIEDVTDEIAKLEKAKLKTFDEEKLKRYNKKLEEAKQTLKEYNELGVKSKDTTVATDKATKSWGSSLAGLALKFLSVAAVIKAVKGVFESTDKSALFFKGTIEGVKAGIDFLAKSIATFDFTNFLSGFREAIRLGRDLQYQLNEIADVRREYTIKELELNKQIEENRRILYESDRTSNEEKQEASTAILRDMKLKADMEKELAIDTYNVVSKTTAQKNKMTQEDIRYTIENYSRVKDIGDQYNRLTKIVKAYDYWVKKLGEDNLYIDPFNTGAFKVNAEYIAKIRQQIAELPDDADKLGELAKQYDRLTDKEKDAILTGISNIKRAEYQFEAESKRVYSLQQNLIDRADQIAKQGIKTMAEGRDALLKRFSETEIEQLTGVDQLRAMRDDALYELRKFREDLLTKLGILTPEDEAKLQAVADNIFREFLKATKEVKAVDIGTVTDSMKRWMDVLFPDLDDFSVQTKDKLREYKGTFSKEAETFREWFWGIFAIDPDSEEGQDIISGIVETGEVVKEAIQDLYENRVEDAQRTRELLDTKIAETQQAIEMETQLLEAGFANNLDAQKKYLEEVKKQRDKAIREEEEAIKKQRMLEAVLQSINLISASTEILKNAFKLNPLLGLLVAGTTIAAMFAIFKSAKTTASKETKLAEGGTGTDTGIIKGKSHSEGGERFLEHVTVERGERWGVLNKQASQKYGRSFDYIVNSFNKNEVPVVQPNEYKNNIVVNNEGANDRLDRVIAEQRKLNEKYGKETVIISGKKKIIVKGKNIRIVG